jgi:putative hydrolases of HD superfamily
MMMENGRFQAQRQFLLEIDKLKRVLRRTYITGGERHENSAEHSWHLALMATTLVEYADELVDLNHVIRLLLFHDIVEIDAGDTFFFDDTGYADKAAREQRAADRIFGLLPPEQGAEFRALWDEFEARQTAEARFANALDRLIPLLLNYAGEGYAWRENGVTASLVLNRMGFIAEGSPALWQFVQELMADAVAKGYLVAGG